MSTSVAVPTAAEVFSCDEESVQEMSFIVSKVLAEKLTDQLERLATVDATRSGKERYQLARQAGCFAAIAKGAKNRKLEPNKIYVPKTEIVVNNGVLRITALKATFPLPENVTVKGIVFEFGAIQHPDYADVWTGYVEVVKDNAEAHSSR